MADYQIHYYDPLKAAVDIAPLALNGPMSGMHDTELALHGRGFLDWGENVDENFLRLAENFASATAPLHPIEGQTWFRVNLYVHNTVDDEWFRWDYSTETWQQLTSELTVSTTEPSQIEGTYWYNPTSDVLKRWDSHYTSPSSPQWVVRAFIDGDADPVDRPTAFMSVWDGNMWASVSGVVSQATAPGGSQVGQIWYNPATQTLYVFDDSLTPQWTPILLANGFSEVTANMNFGGHNIKNVMVDVSSATVDLTSAATKGYSDGYIDLTVTQAVGDNFQSHITSDVLHTTATQKDDWLDQLSVNYVEINNLRNIRRNVQDQLDDLEAITTQDLSNKVSIAGDTMTGALRTVATIGDRYAVTKQYVDNARYVSKLTDVVVPNVAVLNGGFVDGDVLRYKDLRWEPVPRPDPTDLRALRVVVNYPVNRTSIDSGSTVTISVWLVNEDGSETANPAGTTYTITSGPGSLSGSTFTAPSTNTSKTITQVRVTNGTKSKIVSVVTEAKLTVNVVTVYGNNSYNHNDTATFSAIATWSDGVWWFSTDAIHAGSFAWKRDGITIASPTFVIPTTLTPGPHTISATVSGVTGVKTITINAVPTSLAITGSASSIVGGQTRDFNATATMSDGTTKGVEPVWYITSGAGTISATGVYTAPVVSTSLSVTIQAQYTEAGVNVTSASVTFNVTP
jgi:hypothetical protein